MIQQGSFDYLKLLDCLVNKETARITKRCTSSNSGPIRFGKIFVISTLRAQLQGTFPEGVTSDEIVL